MTILDTGKLGQTLLKLLSANKNVEIKYYTEVTGYKIENSLVKAVKTSQGDIPCDIVVLCNGPQAPYHIYEHFKEVLPSIQAQGYCFNMATDAEMVPLSLRLGNAPYSYCPYTKGLVRFSALMDFGCFEQPYFD